jgi:hypothetical protein
MRTLLFCIGIGFMWSALPGCEFIKQEEGGSGGIGDFRLSGITGWTENEQSGYAAFSSGTLFDLINGGADQYNDEGLVEGIQQKMTHSSGDKAYSAFVMDFGTAENATAMFEKMKLNEADPLTIGNYIESVAFGSRHLSGINAYAHFGKYYVEISLSGYADESLATKEAEAFVEVYEQKAQ